MGGSRCCRATVFLEGIAISAGALIPQFFWAAAVWLLYDLVGAGVWIPIQSAIIQDECREESRGLDLGKTLAFSALGGAIGPILAGHLAGLSISAPFLVSGALVAASAGVLFARRISAPIRLPRAPCPRRFRSRLGRRISFC